MSEVPTTELRPAAEKHPVDQVLPAGRLIVLGLLQVLVIYAGCVAGPLIVGGALGLSSPVTAILINVDLLVAGVITIVRSLGSSAYACRSSPPTCRRSAGSSTRS